MTKEKFDVFMKKLNKKPIYNIIWINDNIMSLEFYVGNPKLIIENKHTGEHNFKYFDKYIKDQNCYSANIESEIKIKIFGNWEIQYNSKVLISKKTNENNIQEILNIVFQGHTITEIKNIGKEKIKISFSNKKIMFITMENNVDGLIKILYGNYFFGISNNDGLIGKAMTEKKYLDYYMDK